MWVVDTNRKVFVYNTSGGLLGSWTAGGLTASSQPEGITVNGNDVWIVDNKSDKVFRYANAASLTSGSPKATSSFSLNTGNTNPKDLVTDGISIWVVDDSTTDKVFKYNASNGAILGSWTITGGGGSPTGITLDPSNVSQSLWIVDRSTLSVYEYANARANISGSQQANVTFLLAADNSPQGIADPPPSSSGLVAAPASNVSNSTFSSRFTQAPVVSLGVPSTERIASLQRVSAETESVDEFMSQLASSVPAAPISVSKAQSAPLQSRTHFAEDQSIDLALADEELNDSLHTMVNDLLESTLR